MIYMQKGGYIRLCDEQTAEKLKAQGFAPMGLPEPEPVPEPDKKPEKKGK